MQQVKICKKCKILKPLSEYYDKKDTKDRKFSKCKICLSIISSENYKKPEIKLKIQMRQSSEKYKIIHKKACRKYSLKPEVKEKQHNYYISVKNNAEYKRLNELSRKKYRLTDKAKAINKRQNDKWIKYNKHKVKAHYLLHKAIRLGNIIKKRCAVCGNIKVDAHHQGYDKPLEVLWLCRKHHYDLHRNIKRGIPWL